MKKTLLALLLAASCAHSADLFFTTEIHRPDFYTDPLFQPYEEKCGQHGEIDIAVHYLRSNRDAINKAVNADIPSPEALQTFAKDYMQEILNFFKEDKILEAGATLCNRELKYRAEYYGHYKNLEQIFVDYAEYSGGAHGIYSTEWFVFDENDQRLTLDAILEAGGKDKLYPLLEKTYREQTEAGKSGKSGDAGLDAINDGWFKAVREEADNFYFDAKGLVISYAPYTVASYAEGQVELSVPYGELKGIVRAEYLP